MFIKIDRNPLQQVAALVQNWDPFDLDFRGLLRPESVSVFSRDPNSPEVGRSRPKSQN